MSHVLDIYFNDSSIGGSSGIWHYVIGQVVPDISNNHSAFIFRVKHFLQFRPWRWRHMILWNVVTHRESQCHILEDLHVIFLTIVTQTWQASFPPRANPAHRTRSSMWAVVKVLNASLHCAWDTTGICSCSSCELVGPSVRVHITRKRREELKWMKCPAVCYSCLDTHWNEWSPILQWRGSASRSLGSECQEEVADRWAGSGLQTQQAEWEMWQP